MSYVSRCLAAAPPRPIELYARGGWYITDDLREQLREREGDIEGIAMVWKLKDLPRAVYQWNHDGAAMGDPPREGAAGQPAAEEIGEMK